jgi:uncharacterized protein (TIGR02284 family)
MLLSMMSSNESARLERLIVACHDDRRAFSDAASAHPAHHDELTQLARRRDTFIVALEAVLRAHGKEPSRRGSTLAWWNRVTASVRVAVAGATNMSDTFRSCVRQESRTLEDFEHAERAGSASREVAELVQAQLREIEADLARVRHLYGWS